MNQVCFRHFYYCFSGEMRPTYGLKDDLTRLIVVKTVGFIPLLLSITTNNTIINQIIKLRRYITESLSICQVIKKVS